MESVERTEAIDLVTDLADSGDAVAAAARYRQAVRDAYWEHHDIAAVIVLASAGVAQCLAAARSAEADAGYLLRSEAKALLYDLASFTWPGWGEPGIVVLDRDVVVGLQAATRNLEFARLLDKGDLAVSRALWMMGAQQLAARRHAEATESFAAAADAARRAEAGAEAALAEAFVLLGRVLGGDIEAEQELDAALRSLRREPDGDGLAGQVTTAQDVLSANTI